MGLLVVGVWWVMVRGGKEVEGYGAGFLGVILVVSLMLRDSLVGYGDRFVQWSLFSMIRCVWCPVVVGLDV